MVDALLVEHAEGVAHALLSIVTEMVVGQRHTIDETIPQQVGHMGVAAQMWANLGDLLGRARENGAFQVEHTVVVALSHITKVGKQRAVFSGVQKALGPVPDDQIACYHQSYHAAKVVQGEDNAKQKTKFLFSLVRVKISVDQSNQSNLCQKTSFAE